MSGVKNLSNAIANDPSFAKQAGMTKAEAAQFVSPGKPEASPMPKGVSPKAPTPRSY